MAVIDKVLSLKIFNIKKSIDEMGFHLFHFDCGFDGVFEVSHFYRICPALFELFDDFPVQSLLGNTFLVGLYLVGFAVELESYCFAFYDLTVDFKCCL
jgi:hypothetical protein